MFDCSLHPVINTRNIFRAAVETVLHKHRIEKGYFQELDRNNLMIHDTNEKIVQVTYSSI